MMSSSAVPSNYGMQNLLATPNYMQPQQESCYMESNMYDMESAYTSSPPNYCTLSPSDGYPMYAALQAANDSPPDYGPYALSKLTPDYRRSRGESLASEDKAGGSSNEDDESSENGSSCNKDLSYNENVSQWLNQQACGGVVKRKRKVNKRQRLAANHRERRRMSTFNEAFERLRESIHCDSGIGNKRKKMSRIQTLKSAIKYIGDLRQILGEDSSPSGHVVNFVQEKDFECW